MKRNYWFNITFIVIIIAGCNSKTTNENTENRVTDSTEIKDFDLEINMKLNSTTGDEFRVLFNNIDLDNDHSVNIHVKKSVEKGDQFISFKSNNRYLPEDLIIDLGRKHRKTVTIEEIEIKMGTHHLQIPRNKIEHFFYPNKFLIFNKDSLTFKVDQPDKNQLLIFRRRIMDSLWINE